MFSVNWQILNRQLLPSFIGEKLRAYAFAMIKPLEQLHAAFMRFRDERITETNQTGQVICLEYLLNKKFGGIDNKALAYKPATYFHPGGDARVLPIYIEQTEPLIRPYLYNSAEEKPLTVGNNTELFETYLVRNDDNSFDDFNVNYLASTQPDITYMRSLINKYKIPGFTFKIVSYE
ncbi:MAG: hypothetical protein RBR40_08235 [Tenuifilaceae bacterium]|jgi:hypothetical protein|nr:hypothetical protein [Tenuifilaceae bacterium]